MKVDKNIAIPDSVIARLGRPLRYPWEDMEPGDSFPVHVHDVSKVRASAAGYGKRHGLAFLVARDPTNGAQFRCWRLP